MVDGRRRVPGYWHAQPTWRAVAVTVVALAFASDTHAASAGARPAVVVSSMPVPVAVPATTTRFGSEAVSDDARDVAEWVPTAHDNHMLPFVVIDKVNAKVFAFDRTGILRGTAPALLGAAHGDDSVPGIGQRKLATITPAERTTPAGRFQASLGNDLEQDILWIDYDAALSMHRVIVGRRVDDRAGRLASVTPDDNRISYGCVNVPPGFYDSVVKPLFTGTVGIVYILPDTKPLRAVFPMPPAAR